MREFRTIDCPECGAFVPADVAKGREGSALVWAHHEPTGERCRTSGRSVSLTHLAGGAEQVEGRLDGLARFGWMLFCGLVGAFLGLVSVLVFPVGYAMVVAAGSGIGFYDVGVGRPEVPRGLWRRAKAAVDED